jgi:aspartyl-tRNA(Asn)/glutamyl-tRNA(Gln) amidotransferase subunit B
MKIGLETHIPLETTTKLFSDEARGRLSAYAQGEPGTRPVLQGKAVRHALKLAVTLDMDIASTMTLDRKQYFYPDLPKGYQITQHRHPLATNGVFTTSQGDTTIKEIHLEEDPSRLKHTVEGARVDDSRSGEPLIELVTAPCLTSINETITFLDELATHCKYLGILDQTKGFKTDVNISIEATDHTRVEVKNITGRDNVKEALRYEAWRQKSAVETGQAVERETRHYNDEKTMTTPSRTKETYQDYAYIPEPDIPTIGAKQILDQVRDDLPKPRQDIIDELIAEGISKQEATTIASHPQKRGCYETIGDHLQPSTAQTVITQHLPHILEAQSYDWEDIRKERLTTCVETASKADLPENTVKDLLWQTLFKDEHPEAWVETNVSDDDPEQTLSHLLDDHPSRVEAYNDGNKSVVNAFMGDLAQAHPEEDKQRLLTLIKETLNDQAD